MVKLYCVPTDVYTTLAQPQEVYYQVSFNSSPVEYYEYEKGTFKQTNKPTDNKSYPTFLLSPSGKKTFWFESRDGKNTLFLGDADAENEKELASGSDLTPYGWYGDDYLLLSKSSSELYIRSTDADSPVLKVTDYHKPDYNFAGYGYGYGGF